MAGSLYAIAGLSGKGLENATSEDELVSARSRVNGLAFGAGLAGVAAVGLAGTSFLVDEHGWTVHIGSRF